MKYFSMFSGIGGFELGIQRVLSKAECIGFSEINPQAIEVYKKHYPEHKNYGNATTINPNELPDFELLVGGFPCQAFSIAGKRAGFEDTRGTLFFEIARILSVKKPKLCVLENVEGLLSHDSGRTFRHINEALQGMGYVGETQLLNSRYFGVPQNRPRVFIVGHYGKPERLAFPIEQRVREVNAQPIQKRLRTNIETFFNMSMSEGTRRSLASSHTIRDLSPVEYERAQGFPDGWTEGISRNARYRCVGNSVTPNVIEAIMKKLYEQEIEA